MRRKFRVKEWRPCLDTFNSIKKPIFSAAWGGVLLCRFASSFFFASIARSDGISSRRFGPSSYRTGCIRSEIRNRRKHASGSVSEECAPAISCPRDCHAHSSTSRTDALHHPDQRHALRLLGVVFGKGFDSSPKLASSGLVASYMIGIGTLAAWIVIVNHLG